LVIGRKPSSRENQLNNSNAFRRVEPVKSDRLLAAFEDRYALTYAGLSSAMIALVFLYFSAGIFIYGGELNAAIARARRSPKNSDAVSSPEAQ
jgi:hypothetical protein